VYFNVEKQTKSQEFPTSAHDTHQRPKREVIKVNH